MIPRLPPNLPFSSFSSLLLCSHILPKGKPRPIIGGGNKGGPGVPGRGHPEAGSTLPGIQHGLLWARPLPQAGCYDEHHLPVNFNCVLCACGPGPHSSCFPMDLHIRVWLRVGPQQIFAEKANE